MGAGQLSEGTGGKSEVSLVAKGQIMSNSNMVFGIRSPRGRAVLGRNPFDVGAEIPLASDEELFCYRSANELADITAKRDTAINASRWLLVGWCISCAVLGLGIGLLI